MRAFPMSWTRTLLVFAVILAPCCVIGASSSLLLPEAPLVRPSFHPRLRLTQPPFHPLAPTEQDSRPMLKAPHRPMQSVPARYTPSPAPTVRSRRLTPAMDGNWELEPRPFIGPKQQSTRAASPANRGATFTGWASSAPIFPLSPATSAVPALITTPHQESEYERMHEYEQMNDASHVVLHGDN